MRKKNIILVIILILIIAVIVSIFLILKNKSINNKFLTTKSGDNSLLKTGDNEVPEIINEENKQSIVNNQDTDNNAQNSNVNPSGTRCSEKQIVYSMINFKKTSLCNLNQSGICLDKTINCSMEIKNRDPVISGYFEIELTFAQEENQNNVINKSTSRFFLSPGQVNKFSDSINIQSTGVKGIANKEISCFFNTIETPKKEVC